MTTQKNSNLDDIQLERFLLSSIFIDNDKMVEVYDIIEPKMFSMESHAIIFEIMKKMYSNKIQIDEMTIWKQIQAQGYSSTYLTENDVIYIANGSGCLISGNGAVGYSEAIADRYCNREAKKLYTEVLDKLEKRILSAKEIQDLNNKVSLKICDFNEEGNNTSKVDIDISSVINNIRQKVDSDSKKTLGFKSGISELDTVIDGFQRGRLYSIVGDSGMGKSAIQLQIALINAVQGKNVFIGSFEMSLSELSLRLACMIEELDSSAIYNPKYFILNGIKQGLFKTSQEGLKYIEDKLIHGQEILNALPIYIHESDDPDIHSFLNALNKHVLQTGDVDLVFIDHSMLMIKDRNNLTAESYNLFKKGKDTAKKFNCSVIILHQYSNDIKNSEDCYPNVFSMYAGAALRHACDAILMLYVPRVYKHLVKKNPSLADVCQIIIGKLRYAKNPSEPIECDFDGNCFKDKYGIK